MNRLLYQLIYINFKSVYYPLIPLFRFIIIDVYEN